MDTLSATVKRAASCAAAKPGGTGATPPDAPPFMQAPRAGVKALLPLSIVLLEGGGFAYTAVDAVTVGDSAAFKLRIVTEVGKEPVTKDLAWRGATPTSRASSLAF